MKISILGSESLGVRGLSCVVETHERNIVISHFHGDHIPLAKANPFQLSARKVSRYFQTPELWCKSSENLSPAMARRCRNLSQVLGRRLTCSEGQTDGHLSFSQSMPHGEANSPLGGVMMTRVEDAYEVFVHASDIQLLDSAPVKQILAWKPDIVLASGPPLYLRHLSSKKRKRARENALLLSQEISTLILDHHLLRSTEGYRFLEDLSASASHKIICAADYMGCKRLPLKARRQHLYREMSVPEGWHNAYSQGKADMNPYRKWRGLDIQEIK